MNLIHVCFQVGPAAELHLGAVLLDRLQNRSRTISVPISPPISDRKRQKKQNLKKESVAQFLIKYILQMVLIMGGKADNESVQQIMEILIFSNRLAQVNILYKNIISAKKFW